MPWDVIAVRLPPGKGLMEVTEDDGLPAFATRGEVAAAVLSVAPYADVRDPSWLQVDGPGLRVEVGVGHDEDVDVLAFHVRAGGASVPFVLEVCARLGIDAYDVSADEPLQESSGRESLARWEAYRDQVGGPPYPPLPPA